MAAKQGQLSRADLLKVIVEGDESNQKFVVDYLGLKEIAFDDEQSIDDAIGVMAELTLARLSSREPNVSALNDNQLTKPSPTAQLTSTYWQLLKQVNREDEKEPNKKKLNLTQRPVWNNKPARPDFPALMSEADMQQRLLPKLRQE